MTVDPSAVEQASPPDRKQQLLKAFRDYDDALTCVAAWQYILTQLDAYKDYTHAFDRLPRVQDGNRVLTPDFAARLTRCGLIGEIKAGLPPDGRELTRVLAQLNAYDRLAPICCADRLLPPVADGNVVVLFDYVGATGNAKRLLAALREDEQSNAMSKPPIIMSYHHGMISGQSRFILEWLLVPGNGTFSRVEAEPGGEDLYWFFCDQNAPFHLPPKHFEEGKSQCRITNDAPPPIYTAVLLWEDITSYAIREHLYHPSMGPIQAYVRVPVSISDARRRIEDRWLPSQLRRSFRTGWVRDGFRFLETAGLAQFEKGSTDRVNVRLQPHIGSGSQAQEVASELAERYVKQGKATAPRRAAGNRSRRAVVDHHTLPLEF